MAPQKSNDGIGVISGMNFAAVDLNLLRVFDAMMVELNTTRAGERVGLSQPAVSAALGRLRHITGDALFVREGNRMVATSRALDLAEPVRDALRRIETALAADTAFDPASAERVFRILGSDYFSTLLIPPLARSVRAAAPGVVLQMIDRPNAALAPLLSDGAVDMAVESRIDVPDWVNSRVLYRSFMVTVARPDDPVLDAAGIRPGDRIPPDVFCDLPQAMMSMDGGATGPIDLALAEHGLSRRVALTVPHFHAVALAVAEAGLVANLPVHFARRIAAPLGLGLYRPPFEPPHLDVMLYWHRRHDRDAAQDWLRGEIARALDLGAEETEHADAR